MLRRLRWIGLTFALLVGAALVVSGDIRVITGSRFFSGPVGIGTTPVAGTPVTTKGPITVIDAAGTATGTLSALSGGNTNQGVLVASSSGPIHIGTVRSDGTPGGTSDLIVGPAQVLLMLPNFGGNKPFKIIGDTTYPKFSVGSDTTGVGIGTATPAGALSVAAANGQQLSVLQPTELLTIAAAATTDTSIDIPANCIVLGVDVRVTTVVPDAATFTVKGATTTTDFTQGASVSTAAGTTNAGSKNCPYYNATAQKVRLTFNTAPLTNTGRVRVTIHCLQLTAATS